MTNYPELVKALRYCVNARNCKKCAYRINNNSVKCRIQRVENAAAAIEELQAEVKRLELENEDYEHENRRLLDENEALRKNADEYLRGELEELKEQLNDADIAADDNGRQVEELEAEVKRLEPKRGEWIIHGEPPMLVIECSVCGQKYFNHVMQEKAKYCSMCGAKMGGQNDEP